MFADLYCGVVRQLWGRIGEVKVQSSLVPVKITSLKVSQNVECCAHFGLLAVLCTAPVLQPSFLRFHKWFFSNTSMANLTCMYVYSICNYKSRKFVFCLHFFIDGVESAWPACYFFSLDNYTD